VSRSVEPVLAVGPLASEALYGRTIPMVEVGAEDFARIRSGDQVVVDAVAGELTLHRS